MSHPVSMFDLHGVRVFMRTSDWDARDGFLYLREEDAADHDGEVYAVLSGGVIMRQGRSIGGPEDMHMAMQSPKVTDSPSIYPNPYWDCWMVRPTLDAGINGQVDVLLNLLYRAEGMAIGCGDPDLASKFKDGRWVLRSLIQDVAGMDFDGARRSNQGQ